MYALSLFAVVETSLIADPGALPAGSDHFEITRVPLNLKSKLKPWIGIHFNLQHQVIVFGGERRLMCIVR